ncbi:MAG: hypothetical protein KDE27_20235, partial [Planctomycetes bacterium]|nr:hypothetical protein [Planctomycetota bacterium]
MTATSPARNRVLATATVPLLLAATLTAQCGRQWEALSAIPGTNQPVFDVTTWDPDGAGPAPTVLVAGGPFWRAGAGDARSVATFDFVAGAWNALDTGLDPFSGVRAVASSPAGELVIAGELRVSGLPGSQLERVARWNGTSWDVLGTFDGNVDCVELLPSGDVVAGGLFATVNGQAAPGLARWDGTSWSAIPGFAALYVGDLLVLPNGDLLVAAYLGFASHALQLWNGVSWTTIGQPNEFVNSMAVLPGGDVVVGGSFTAIDVLQVARVARWNGTTWSALGAGITSANAIVWHVTGLPNGNVIAGGSFQAAGSVAVADIARFDGTNWSDMNGGTGGSFGGTVYGLVALPNGDAIAAGSFLRAGGVAAARVARWSPTGWSSLGEGFTASVIDLAEQGGDLVAAGVFAIAGVPGADNIAVRRAGGWQALGTGTDGRVRCVLPRAGGRL